MDQSTVDPAKAGRGRSTGVLLHPTALPGSAVCGSFGEPREARRFPNNLYCFGVANSKVYLGGAPAPLRFLFGIYFLGWVWGCFLFFTCKRL